jgi:ATP-dependent Clp protease ATP-binding subunit ClpA
MDAQKEGRRTMWQRFTERARRVVFFAQEEAGRLGENYVSTEHLLLGLVRENDSVAARILDRMGISLGRVRSEIERQVARGDGKLGKDMQLTPRAKRVIDLAYDEARQLSNNYIGTEHLLLGLIREGEGLAGRVLAKLGVELERTREEVRALQDNDSGKPARTAPTRQQTAYGETFAAAFAELPENERASLVGDGFPLNKLPTVMQQAVQQMFEAGIRSGTFVLDPNSLVRVNITRVEGATHYTVTTRASFLVNFLTRDEPEPS